MITWNGIGWNLTLKDGTVWKFPNGLNVTLAAKAAITSITDRYGNTITMNRDATTGNLLKVISPNGRYITFTYDSANRVTQAMDNSGRTVHYFYDAGGRLIEVDNPLGGSYKYTYDAYNQMLTVTDPRQIVFVTNHYDANGRVIEQDLANGTWLFAYTQDANGNIIQTDVTNPRGKIRRYTFNTNGYFSGGKTTSEIFALGLPEQQTITFQYQSGTNLLLSTTDALGRITNYTYDAKGNVQSVARDLPDALRNLGRALHPVMDSTSPEHMADGVPREWCLPFGCSGNRIHKDHSSSDKNGHERTADITDADYAFEDAYIQGAYSFVTGKKLSCRYPR